MKTAPLHILILLLRPAFLYSINVDAWQSGNRNAPVSLAGKCFEEYWENASNPSDGHSFLGRMSMYKRMIEEQAEYFKEVDTDLPIYHWLWAYGAQLDWQHRSGRLSASKEDSIDVDSWWGYMNFGFSVAIFVAFEETSYGKRRTKLDELSEELLSEPDMQAIVDAWSTLFRKRYRIYKSWVGEAVDKPSLLELKRYHLQQAVWESHIIVIELGVNSERAKRLLKLLPEEERQFAKGWANMVDILAAACFPTDLVTLVQDGAGFLPLEMATENSLSSLQRSKNIIDRRRLRSIRTCQKLADTSVKPIAAFWKRVVRDAKTSRAMPSIVFRLFHGSLWSKIRTLVHVIVLWARP